FFQAEDGIRDRTVTGVQTCALPIYTRARAGSRRAARAPRPCARAARAARREPARARVSRCQRRSAPARLPLRERWTRCARAAARSEERRVGKERRAGVRAEGV